LALKFSISQNIYENSKKGVYKTPHCQEIGRVHSIPLKTQKETHILFIFGMLMEIFPKAFVGG